MRIVLACVLAAGCTYKPGSFTFVQQQFPGTRTVVGCLDISVERRKDLATNAAVLEYQFGNRCERPALVDLVNVNVIGRTPDGAEHHLTPFDPAGELRALEIDGAFAGGEAIAYPSDLQLVQVCVDAASLAHGRSERWLCFANPTPPSLVDHRDELAPARENMSTEVFP